MTWTRWNTRAIADRCATPRRTAFCTDGSFGIDDVVNFEGADVDELERAFHEAVDDYLALCQKLGRAPSGKYSGKIPLRIEADLHRRVAIAAKSEAKSVNGWIADTLAAAAVKTVKGVKSASKCNDDCDTHEPEDAWWCDSKASLAKGRGAEAGAQVSGPHGPVDPQRPEILGREQIAWRSADCLSVDMHAATAVPSVLDASCTPATYA